MYDFRDQVEYAYPERLSLQTVIDGINLDNAIDGFRTLAVKGRELNANDISATTHQSVRSGGGNRTKTKNSAFVTNYESSFISARKADKTITVEYDLKAENNREFREKFELLNFYLRGEEVQAIFTDDPHFFYTVTLSGVSEVDGNGNWVKGSFELLCSNPFKRSTDMEIFRFTDRGELKKYSLYPVYLEEAEIVVQASAEKFILKDESTGRRIILDWSFKPGDVVIIDFIGSMIRTDHGESLMKTLDITSHLESFRLSYGDVLSVFPSGDVSIKYREVRL